MQFPFIYLSNHVIPMLITMKKSSSIVKELVIIFEQLENSTKLRKKYDELLYCSNLNYAIRSGRCLVKDCLMRKCKHLFELQII